MKYGPVISGTFADANCRFYDDKSTYTGVHKNGGPTVIDKEKYGLENRVSRKYDKKANLLVKKGVEALSQEGVYMQSPNNPNKSFNDSPIRHVSMVQDRANETPVAMRRASQAVIYESSSKGLPSSGDLHDSTSAKSSGNDEEYTNAMKILRSMHEPVKSLFLSLCLHQSTIPLGSDAGSLKERGMDSMRWAKFCRDSNLLDGIALLQPQDVDLIFMRAKNYNCPNPKVVRKLNYSAFRRALYLLAVHIKMPFDQFINFILYSSGSRPSTNGAASEHIRFYDDPHPDACVHGHCGPLTTDVEKHPLLTTIYQSVDDRMNTMKPKTSSGNFRPRFENQHHHQNSVENSIFQLRSTVTEDLITDRPSSSSVHSRDSFNYMVQSRQQTSVEERISQFQQLLVAQQKEYLYLDSKLSEEMMKLEHDLKSEGVSSKFYPNLTTEGTEKLYNETLQKRITLKEKFKSGHEV